MTTPTVDLATVRAGLNEILEPLREQLAQLDTAVEQQVVALKELRETRDAVRRTIALLDPSSTPKKKNADTNGGLPKKTVSGAMYNRIRQWLELHDSELSEGFSASSLSRTDINVSQAQLSAALPGLREQGLVRLDRRGPGGAKIYKLIAR